MRRRFGPVVGVLLVLGGLLVAAFGPAAAGAAATGRGADTVESPGPATLPPGTTQLVEVVEVSGLFDPVLVRFVEDRIAAANERGLVWLVLRLNSPGSVVSDEEILRLARLMRQSAVPVAVWVGPSSAQARGASAQLVGAASSAGIASGAQVGKAGEQILPRDEFGVLFGDAANRARDAFVRFDDAESAGLVPAATLGDFIIDLDGVATKSVEVEGETRREPATTVRFVQLPLHQELLHTVASPSVAYLLFAIGVGLLLFELFTAGIGIAGVVGAVFLLLGCYGLAVLPVRWWALAVLLGSFVAFAFDVQTGIPRRATAVGIVMFLVGTFFLYDGVGLSWVTVLSAVVLLLVVYLRGMPAMVRTRFSALDLDRGWLVGEEGTVITELVPASGDGLVPASGDGSVPASGDGHGADTSLGSVAVRDAPWPARTTTGPLQVGDRIRVVGADGYVLEVAAVTH